MRDGEVHVGRSDRPDRYVGFALRKVDRRTAGQKLDTEFRMM
jgi:hypothetical protein